MKIIILSDTHGNLPDIPACDIMIHAGDICPVFSHKLLHQKLFLNGSFKSWLERIPSKYNIIIPGNHDYIFQDHLDAVPKDWRCHLLIDSAVEVEGVKIWGTPWQNWFLDWAFNAPEENGEEFLASKYSLIPPDTDIIVSHGPPFGYGDLTSDGRRVGSHALLKTIDEIHPRLVATGHIHESRGVYTHASTTIINASAVNLQYRPYQRMHTEFELDVWHAEE